MLKCILYLFVNAFIYYNLSSFSKQRINKLKRKKKNDAITRTISHKYKPNILNINIYEYYLELESLIYLMLFSFLDDQKEENDYLFIYKILIFELQKIFVMKRFEKKYKLNINSI